MKKSKRILCAVLSFLCTVSFAPQTAFAAEETPEFPATFDLRNVDGMNFVTPVKDQGMTNTCWAHAAMAASETSILYENWKENGIKPEETALDLSELHLIWFNRTPISENDPYYASQAGEGKHDSGSPVDIGGTVFDRMRILEAGMGPVMEADVPLMSKSGNVLWFKIDEENDDLVYDEDGNPVTELHPLDWEAPEGWYSYAYNVEGEDFSVDESYRYQSVIALEHTNILEDPAIYNRDFEYQGYNENATNQIKAELMQGRGVAIAYCADEEHYLSEYSAHYTCDPQYSNHDVTIVGWDDSYSRENFKTGTSEEGNDFTPPGDGAWIVKNSWSSLDTEPFPNYSGVNGSGYFYLSYYDKSLCNPSSFDYDISTLNATYNAPAFQYDFLNGYYTHLVADTPDSGANVFTSTENRLIDAVSTFTLIDDADVTYQIYKLNPDYTSPIDGELMATVDTHYDYWGYKREKLETPVAISAGQTFSVVVTIKDEDGYYWNTVGADTSEKFDEAWNANIEDELWKHYGYSTAVINPGESWVSEEGEWKDLLDFDEMLTTYYGYDPNYEAVFGSREITIEDGQVYENLVIKAFGNQFDAITPEVTLTTDAETYQAGNAVTFKAVLTNPSDTFDILNVQLKSASTGYEFGEAVPIIPAGQSIELTYDYIIQESDVKDGKFSDTLTITANGMDASAEADVSVITETIEEPTQDTTETSTETPTEEPTQDTTEASTETPTEEPTQDTTEASTETPTEEPAQDTTLPADAYSLDDLKKMALKDYAQKNGSSPESAEAVINEDGTVTIQMNYDSYTVDPVTGKGTNSTGEAVDLPQTGNNSVKTAAAAGIAALFTAGGAFAVFKSGIFRRKKEND